MPTSRALPIVALALLLGGCGGARPGSYGTRAVTGWKTVMSKVEPAYLIAVDRSECTMTAKRFEGIKEGDNVFCVWRLGGLAGAGTMGPPTDGPRIPGSTTDRPGTPPPGTPPQN